VRVLRDRGLPALDNEGHLFGNYGILDQQAVLKWVECNIARFGGGKDNVTVGGGNESKQAHSENMGRSLQIGRPTTSGQVCNRVGRSHQFVQQLKALSGQLGSGQNGS
jgi:hypothetical protein